MIRIRFFRVGRKRKPFYKIVVTDSKNAPSGGRFIEEVGFYDPTTKDCKIKEDRVKHWIGEGVSVSDTVYNLLVRKQIILGKKRPTHSVSKKEVTEEPVDETKEEVTKEAAKEEPAKDERKEEPVEEVTEENPVEESVKEEAKEEKKN